MEQRSTSIAIPNWTTVWAYPLLLTTWCVVLCLIPDPRPLGAPRIVVDGMRSLLPISEPESRAISTVILRAAGIALIGILLSLCLKNIALKYSIPIGLIVTPIFAVLCQWINYGYFPIFLQLQLGVVSAIVGALLGLAISRSWIAGAILGAMLTGLYLWGTSTGISKDLDIDARATGEFLLANSISVPNGDEGFVRLVELAFAFAQDNSHASDVIHPNKAAILALGVILGHERIAQVAKRPINLDRVEEFNALRNRVTLIGRHDLARHFWVSSALAVLSDENRSMTVGVGKELMDATEGGSGFSFVDLMADRAGTLLAIAATKSEMSARSLQTRISHGVVIADLFPKVDGLPEGLSRNVFQSDFGGLGGKETQKLMTEIESRLSTCEALRSSN